MKTGNMETVFNKGTETSVVQSFKPSLRQHWLLFTISAFSILLALTKFNVKTVTGLCILSISGLAIIYRILSVYTTQYIITHRGIFMKKGPFSCKFKELTYGDINNITIRQGIMQRRLKIGNLIIHTNQPFGIIKGVKKPHQIKELIKKEKASDYERRTLLRRIL
jgi:uncharacterized membrane protein YdbT with pleckstrin-like domain